MADLDKVALIADDEYSVPGGGWQTISEDGFGERSPRSAVPLE
jgi:hypothetical protein